MDKLKITWWTAAAYCLVYFRFIEKFELNDDKAEHMRIYNERENRIIEYSISYRFTYLLVLASVQNFSNARNNNKSFIITSCHKTAVERALVDSKHRKTIFSW